MGLGCVHHGRRASTVADGAARDRAGPDLGVGVLAVLGDVGSVQVRQRTLPSSCPPSSSCCFFLAGQTSLVAIVIAETCSHSSNAQFGGVA